MKDLETILKEYNFVKKNCKVFLKNPKIIDDHYEYLSCYGYKGYHKLINLLYDIGLLTGRQNEICGIIDDLDVITSENNY